MRKRKHVLFPRPGLHQSPWDKVSLALLGLAKSFSAIFHIILRTTVHVSCTLVLNTPWNLLARQRFPYPVVLTLLTSSYMQVPRANASRVFGHPPGTMAGILQAGKQATDLRFPRAPFEKMEPLQLVHEDTAFIVSVGIAFLFCIHYYCSTNKKTECGRPYFTHSTQPRPLMARKLIRPRPCLLLPEWLDSTSDSAKW